jgi:hypothetical protein
MKSPLSICFGLDVLESGTFMSSKLKKQLNKGELLGALDQM